MSDQQLKTKKRSIIQKYFSKEVYIELLRITFMGECDNNDKGFLIKELLREHNIPFTSLGSGTNRLGVLIDGYAVKIALDDDGRIDNRREMLYSKQLQPYVVKVYECIPSGLIAVTEFVEIFTLEDFRKHQEQMAEILKDISQEFLIGDVGITGKNYGNWGFRNDGTICILDFAYIYSVKFSVFNCSCDETALLRYDKNFVDLYCPKCGRKYSFGEVRRRITREHQEEEIGDIRRLGYNLQSEEQIFIQKPEFEPRIETKKKKKKELSESELAIKEYNKMVKEAKKLEEDYWNIEQ